jgi:hypothetical protein
MDPKWVAYVNMNKQWSGQVDSAWHAGDPIPGQGHNASRLGRIRAAVKTMVSPYDRSCFGGAYSELQGDSGDGCCRRWAATRWLVPSKSHWHSPDGDLETSAQAIFTRLPNSSSQHSSPRGKACQICLSSIPALCRPR